MLLQDYKKLFEHTDQVKAIYKNGQRVWPSTYKDYSEPFYVENTTNSDETLSITSSYNAGQKTIEHSYDATNWETLIEISTNRNFTTTLPAGTKMYLRCKTYSMQYVTIKGIDTVGGNTMSLLYGNEFRGTETEFPLNSGYSVTAQFNSLLSEGVSTTHTLTDASKLILPATTLKDSCYTYMFYGCKALTTTPALPATTLAGSCYYMMFRDCTSLTTTPELPATTLDSRCYQAMFVGCTALTTVPASLPATTMAYQCYSQMFQDCTALTVAPSLPATTLAGLCYDSMFYNCTSLTTAPSLNATTLAQQCYSSMFSGCTALTTAPASLPATTLAQSCYSGMFYGCTSLTTAPSLPATTLAQSCYSSMFYGCTSLTTAPSISATTLEASCCYYMFYNCTSLTTAPELLAPTLVDLCYMFMFGHCTSLNYVKCLAEDGFDSEQPTVDWLYDTASTGTFVKKAGVTWERSTSGIPYSWTVVEQ